MSPQATYIGSEREIGLGRFTVCFPITPGDPSDQLDAITGFLHATLSNLKEIKVHETLGGQPTGNAHVYVVLVTINLARDKDFQQQANEAFSQLALAFPKAYLAKVQARVKIVRHALSHKYQGTIVHLEHETGAIAHVSVEELNLCEEIQIAKPRSTTDSVRTFARFSLREKSSDPDRIETVVRTICDRLRLYLLTVRVDDDRSYELLEDLGSR